MTSAGTQTFTIEVDTETVADLARNARSRWPQQKATATLREHVGWAAKRLQPVPDGHRAEVTVTQRSWSSHHRDPDNVSGPAKAIIDGLVDVGVLADDCACHVASVTLRQINGDRDVTKRTHRFVVTVRLETDDDPSDTG